MTKKPAKTNLSSEQVLKTLQILLQGNFTMQELVSKLNVNEPTPIFNNSVVSKYINTCRFCGIDIPKIHNKYFVTSMPFGLELTSSDIHLLEVLQNIVKQDMAKKYNTIFGEFIDKLNRFSNKKLGRVEKETYQATAELFELALKDKRKIRLMFKNKVLLDCTPVKIVENKGKTFFNIVVKGKERMIDMSRVSGIEVLNEKFIQSFSDQVVVYKLKGALAQRYSLRECERLLQEFDGECIVVSNNGEGKEILFSRLLRYDDKCEIINPKPYREEMKQIIANTLKNYEL